MKQRSQGQGKWINTIRYIVEDLLSIKASMADKQVKALLDLILSRDSKGGIVTSIEGFYVDKKLVLIDGIDPGHFESLICVHPYNGTVRILRLSKSDRRSNGSPLKPDEATRRLLTHSRAKD